jgi:hypothetical protein
LTGAAALKKQKLAQTLGAPDKGLWYLVPVRIQFHYVDDDDSFIDSILDIPMTDPLIQGMKVAKHTLCISEETALQGGLQAVMLMIRQKLIRRLPERLREKCTMTINITGPISYSNVPLH